EAIVLAIAGGHFDLASDLLEAHGAALIEGGRRSSVETWVAALPKPWLRARTGLAALVGLIALARQEERCEPALGSLTAREREVLQLIADGYSVREIAKRLGVGHETARTHARRLFQKLDVHTRVQAIARASALGLLHRPTSAVGA